MHVSSFVFHSVFLCQLHAHTCPFIMYCSRLFVAVFIVYNTFKHDIVHWVTEVHLSTKFHAPVCEIGKLNQNKRERRRILILAICNLTTFLGI